MITNSLNKPQPWVDYDKEADVLYINFDKPQKADNAVQTSDGIIKRIRNKKTNRPHYP